MLPPGHVAGGYLTTRLILNVFALNISLADTQMLLWVGVVSAFAPDLDMFYAFYKQRSFIHPSQKVNHRAYITHTPLFWLSISGMIWFLFGNGLLALVVFLGGVSHLVLDSLQHGVMWLWPYSKQYYALRDSGIVLNNTETEFFSFWILAVKQYSSRLKFTFFSEIVIIAIALFFLFK